MNHYPHHLIFEGAELCGKSFLMSQVYDVLERRYNKSGNVLDGCHWFNCDVGIFGTAHGLPCLRSYLDIMEELKDSNLLLEKFYLSDKIYNRLYNKMERDYRVIESRLRELAFKIIAIKVDPDPEIFQKRLQDRLKLYPHYERIAHTPDWYLRQQEEYQAELKKTSLPYLEIDLTRIPNPAAVDKIFSWLGENK